MCLIWDVSVATLKSGHRDIASCYDWNENLRHPKVYPRPLNLSLRVSEIEHTSFLQCRVRMPLTPTTL